MGSNVVSHYRLLDRLGEGGMGVVYRAEDLRLGREVAVKLLRTDSSTPSEWLGRFEREARLASSLQHAHICTIHELGEHEGQPIQRPSWNYRSEDGGGMIIDMHCHWRYVIDNLFGLCKVVEKDKVGELETHLAKMTDKAKETLNAVSKVLTTEDLINLNRAVSGSQKQNPKDAAAAWLKEKGLVQ